MRKTSAAITILALVLATAGVALAAFTQHASVNFTTHKAGKSTGLVSDLHSTVASSDQLKSTKTVVMTFPVNTRFNLVTPKIKRCTLSDGKLTSSTAPASCPRSSRIGTGSGAANIGPFVTTNTRVPLTVKAFVRNSGTMILVASSPLAPPQVIHAVVRGRKLTINVPQAKLGTTPIIVSSLKLRVPALGTGKKALIRSGRCVNKQFVVKTLFKYTDGTSQTITSTSSCS